MFAMERYLVSAGSAYTSGSVDGISDEFTKGVEHKVLLPDVQ